MQKIYKLNLAKEEENENEINQIKNNLDNYLLQNSIRIEKIRYYLFIFNF